MRKPVLFAVIPAILILGFMMGNNVFADTSNHPNTSIREFNENTAEVKSNLQNTLIGERMNQHAEKVQNEFIAEQQSLHRQQALLFAVDNNAFEQWVKAKPELALKIYYTDLNYRTQYLQETTVPDKLELTKILQDNHPVRITISEAKDVQMTNHSPK